MLCLPFSCLAEIAFALWECRRGPREKGFHSERERERERERAIGEKKKKKKKGQIRESLVKEK